MRSVTFSPPPPIQIGSRSCTGFGSHCASVSVKNSPSKSVRVLGEQAAHALDRLFDLAQPHAGACGNAMPYASYSLCSHPPPRPSVMRPSAIWSSVAIAFASTAGWR